MRPIDLIHEWALGFEWGRRAWCCSLGTPHLCGVLHGGDPKEFRTHWPFVMIPLGYRNPKNGAGISIKLMILPYHDRVKTLRVHAYAYNYPDYIDEGGLPLKGAVPSWNWVAMEDPDFLGKLEGHVVGLIGRFESNLT